MGFTTTMRHTVGKPIRRGTNLGEMARELDATFAEISFAMWHERKDRVKVLENGVINEITK